MKLSELNDIKVSLARLLEAPGIPAKVAYRAAKFSHKVEKELRSLEEARVALVKKWGVENEDGNLYVPPKNLASFNVEFNGLLSEEVDIPSQKFSLVDVENAKLTMLDFAHLEFLFEDSKE